MSSSSFCVQLSNSTTVRKTAAQIEWNWGIRFSSDLRFYLTCPEINLIQFSPKSLTEIFPYLTIYIPTYVLSNEIYFTKWVKIFFTLKKEKVTHFETCQNAFNIYIISILYCLEMCNILSISTTFPEAIYHLSISFNQLLLQKYNLTSNNKNQYAWHF